MSAKLYNKLVNTGIVVGIISIYLIDRHPILGGTLAIMALLLSAGTYLTNLFITKDQNHE